MNVSQYLKEAYAKLQRANDLISHAPENATLHAVHMKLAKQHIESAIITECNACEHAYNYEQTAANLIAIAELHEAINALTQMHDTIDMAYINQYHVTELDEFVF